MQRLRVYLSLLLVFFAGPAALALSQPARPLVVMNLAAHPDDEDGSTLAYYRHAKNAVAYSVIFTRGEGGQNEIGPELYEALGAIRTGETERAARILGTQVFFLNFQDFGFSKEASEAFSRWGGRDSVTARLVYMIRRLKPDVLFTNHDTVTVGPNRQHGQHQAVGIAAYDAFALAADPSFHPEQLSEEGVDLWQPSRLFLRHWRAPQHYSVAVPVGDIDPATGESYATRAGQALREHASQGMASFADRFRPDATYFTLMRSATDIPVDKTDLAGGLPPNSAARPDLRYRIDAGRAPSLPAGTLTLNQNIAVPGDRVRLTWDGSRLPSEPMRWTFSGAIDTTFVTQNEAPMPITLRVNEKASPTLPKETYQYGRIINSPPVVYRAEKADDGTIVAAGYLPLEVAPPFTLGIAEPVVRLKPGLNRVVLKGERYTDQGNALRHTIAVVRDRDGTVLAQEAGTTVLGEDRQIDGMAFVTLPDSLEAGDYTVRVTALIDSELRPSAAVSAEARGRVFQVAVPPDLRVGVVASYDNTLAQALGEMNVPYVLLDSAALAAGRLDTLQTIVVDIRAYLVRPDLRRWNNRLLDWAKGGGNLIVTYQKTFEWNDGQPDPFLAGKKNPANLAPFPLHIGRDRVTHEEAPVTLLAPAHPIFNWPNPITAGDWNGWVQERGLYFPDRYDDAYRELLSLSDPGEEPLRGGILLAQYGQGTYIYTPLVWYRQLKELHAGAYRIFANMLALPLAPQQEVQATH